MIKELWNGFRTKLMLYKQYISRSNTYLSLIQSGMILYLFLARLKDAGFLPYHIEQYMTVIVIFGTWVLLLIGWFEIKVLKGIYAEATIAWEFTPPQVEMKSEIDEMYADFKARKEKENAKG